MELTLRTSAVVSDVYAEMVTLRLRGDLHTDSARLAAAIRTIATRRGVRFNVIESDLDAALAYRRA